MSRRLRPASVAQISPEASLSTLTTSPNITYSTAEEWLKVHVNSFLQFHDPELAEEYKNFHTAHQTYIPIVCAVLFILCILVPYTIAFIISVTSTDSNPVKDHEIIGWMIIYVLLVLFLSIFSLSCLIIRGYFKNFVNLNRFFINNVYSLRSFTFIGINTIICAHLVFRVMNGECEDNEDSSWNFWTCNPHSSTRGLPIDSVVLTIIVPRLLSLVMREVNGKIQGFCWLSASTSLFFCGSYVGARHSFLFFVIYCLGLVLILYDSSCHKLTLFYHYDNLRKTLAENERKADEIHATEMRHMIGNVAHDLKTPLSSFLSGIEFIIHVTTELRAKLTSNKTCGPEDLYDTLQAISNCTKNMTSTNRFMLMAINRCIDYTKASKGLKLNPKFETIDLMETLSLPLNCMSDVQSTVTIRLLPIPKQICSHIITDKQWLQENILCLLSNAVKYSSEGEVTISLSLHTEVKGNGGLFKKMKSIMVSRRALTDLEDCDTETGKMTQPPIPQPSAAAKYMAETSVPTLSPRSKEDDSDKSSTISRTSRMIQPEVFLRIEIEDHGIGIEDDVMPNLFSPFKQAQRLAGGTGLGLYSLAKRIEALKGHYGVRHRRDLKHGTLFWFEFPYRPDSFSANLSKSPPPREISASSVSPLPSITGIPSFTSLASNNTVALHQANNSWRSSNSEMNKGFPSSPATPTYQLHQSMMTTTTTLTTTAPSNNFTVQDFSSRDSPLPVNLEGNGSFPPPTEPQSAINNSLSPSFTLKVPKKPLNILLVDDAASILKMSSMMLKRGGHKITTAVNGADALHKIYHTLPGQLITPLNPNEPLPNFFDVIIMDLQMPVMDGLEATRRVRRLETTGQLQSTKRDNSNLSTPITEANNLIPVAPDIPRTIIIGCSANSDDETIEEAYKAGVDAFMAKPFSIDAFYQIYDELTNSPVEEEGGDEKSDINSRSNTPTKVDGIHKVLVKVASISGRAMSHNNLNQASRHKLTPHVSRQISQSRYLSTVTDVVDYNI